MASRVVSMRSGENLDGVHHPPLRGTGHAILEHTFAGMSRAGVASLHLTGHLIALPDAICRLRAPRSL